MPQGRVIDAANEGWVYTRGALLGVRPDMEVIIDLGNGKEEKVKVDAVSLKNQPCTCPYHRLICSVRIKRTLLLPGLNSVHSIN